jgi:hypothetical protein
MGTLGDNLLKLTEFPFSYSLIGLLALIFGGQGFLGQPLEKLGPLLILMGFVATTLSITDPIGALQKLSIGGSIRRHAFYIDPQVLGIAGWGSVEYVVPLNVELSLLRNFDFQAFNKRLLRNQSKGESVKAHLSVEELGELDQTIQSLTRRVLRTKWIVREIDKITAIGYFVIVVSIFVGAEIYSPNFLDKLLVTSEGDHLAGVIIFIFSLIALGSVSFMLLGRLLQLRGKAKGTLRYLVALDAIKIEKERFHSDLKEIERYLNDGDWTLVGYWTTRVLRDYDDLINDWKMREK